ncbi:SAM-dependent methyltransferase [Mycobacterium sp. WMMD1722]|uniref:SAM-dependent methyltransferase n=1 Tax=Mycobacterium sp. WMMD1722 TaxID=3404117 RepID=UPI003BF4AE6D
MTGRLPDDYFAGLYAGAEDPWSLQSRWYERRKYAITTAVLPHPRYRHAFEPGCSVGVLTELLAARCDRVTSTDVAQPALDATRRRLIGAGAQDRVRLVRQSVDEPWPEMDFDLVVLSEVCYYLHPATLRAVLDREIPRLSPGAIVLAAHWRHPVAEYPMTGDEATDLIDRTPGLHPLGGYRDADVAVGVWDTGSADSVATRTEVPGA